jgi:hypothetical protein
LGRWLSRDPIEERGSFNLYDFVKNSPLCNIDIHGARPVPVGVVVKVLTGAIGSALAILSTDSMSICHENFCKKDCDRCCNTLLYAATAGVTGAFLVAEVSCLGLVNPWLIVTCHTVISYTYGQGLKRIIDKSSECSIGCVNKNTDCPQCKE